jgi:hypothetical protein
MKLLPAPHSKPQHAESPSISRDGDADQSRPSNMSFYSGNCQSTALPTFIPTLTKKLLSSSRLILASLIPAQSCRLFPLSSHDDWRQECVLLPSLPLRLPG